jgi:flagellar hook protein FlgE
MLTGFTGINSNSTSVDVVGDNLANLNTTAFKTQRTLFETLLYRTLSEGSGPSAQSGGTLPEQIGTGSQVAAIQRNFAQGGIDSTGFQSDLAVDGDGFFILNAPTGEQWFTRDGAFHLDATQTMVSNSGDPLQVFLADAAGNIDTSTLANLVIPLGATGQAIATENVEMDGRVDPGTNVSTTGAVVTSQALVTASGPATDATALTSLVNLNGVPLFAAGDELTIGGSKGGIAVPESTFIVGATGNTLGDLAAYMQDVLGIDTTATATGSPGVRMENGMLLVESNVGQINAVTLDESSIVNTTGAIQSPFAFNTTTPAVGTGITTTFGVFDALGNLVDVRLRAVVESKSDTGITWRFFAESTGDSDLSPLLGTGTITFDANGQFVGATGTDLSIDRAGSGVATPLDFTLDFSRLTGLVDPGGESQVVMATQDGLPAGILTNYSIDREGIVTAVYSNQREVVLGQVALATFPNDEGLIAKSDNVFLPGPNSGAAAIGAPLTGTAGAVLAGALEQSNVEIAREFITLITASTGIAAASRVVRTADNLLQELLLVAR